ncbi:DNA glycosylase, partial [Fimicolochytrium jonesii]|uniref:DNA glycosylase n=1 Tax=Fimicolochytrium jonesii TaxID=1396493 RepID=UPI0022FDD82E
TAWKGQAVYDVIEVFRKSVTAPVDWCGCAQLGRKDLGNKVYRFEVLVALILSAQTPDLKLEPAVRKLQEAFPMGITPDAILETKPEVIRDHLKWIGMQNQKTKALIGTSQICSTQYHGDIPTTFEELLLLPGVGPKIAALTMSAAWHKHVAIGVDTHLHRISNRLGWVTTKTPEETRKRLQMEVPEELWGPINPLMVGFGQVLCKAVNPACEACPVKELCPKRGVKAAKKR